MTTMLARAGEQHANETEQLAINTIRALSIDGVQQANSGHPGAPLGQAAIAYVLWHKYLHHNPRNPKWADRDRFILSSGHGSMLLYSLLYLTGYDLSLDDLKAFRTWESKTPGHPEFNHTAGVETTTGPLGQGFSNGVGMAMAEAHLAAVFNKAGHEVVNHYTYAICSDGDLEEGISHEAASLAGHLKLGKLIYFYDDNHISIEGDTDITFTDDTGRRFEAYGWHVQHIDGHDLEEIDNALEEAHKDARPSLIIARTHIGFGSPVQDSDKAHGSPLGPDGVKATKENLGYPSLEPFYVDEGALKDWRTAVEKGAQLEQGWNEKFAAYRSEYPHEAAEFERRMAGKLPEGWANDLPTFTPESGEIAGRDSSNKVLVYLSAKLPELIGGSADLGTSNGTYVKTELSYGPDSYQKRNIHFGVREHNMGGVVVGMSEHGGVRPFGATFLIFYDYMRPPVRLAALSRINPLFVYTHDSFYEDGPTHGPVEQLMGMRMVPNTLSFRPADGNEVAASWKCMIEQTARPGIIILGRQKLPNLAETVGKAIEGVAKGAYVLSESEGANGNPDVVLIATGSEVSLAIKSKPELEQQGLKVRVVSMPAWNLFEEQEQSYRDQVLPPSVKLRLAIEAGSPFGWERWVGSEGGVIGINRFGVSASSTVSMEKFGFNVDNVVQTVTKMLAKSKDTNSKAQEQVQSQDGSTSVGGADTSRDS